MTCRLVKMRDLVFPFLLLQYIHCANITVQPVSINATLNSTVIFTCEANADELTFRVNNKSATDGNVISKGFAVSTGGSGGVRRGELQTIAYDFNNNTNIRCRAITYIPLTAVFSNTAVLLIQGPLASVGDLNYTYINGSSVLLTWTAPYSLDNVPITGYHVDDDFDNITTTNTNATLSTTDPDPCVSTSISVFGINGAGIGQTNHISFYYQRVPPSTPTILLIPIINEARQQVSINISINVSTLCIGEYPNSITVIILDINNVVQDTLNVPTQVNDQLMISGTVSVPNNLNTFIINVTMSNNGGEFLPTSSLIVFGFLGPVTNIRSIIDNCTNISIYWDSPTLDDDRVSILYYNLSIYDDIAGSLMNTVIVNGTSYEFEDTHLFRHRYTYVITGVNELGGGISNNKTFSYQRVPRGNAVFNILAFTQTGVIAQFNIPIIFICINEPAQNVKVTIHCGVTVIFNSTYIVDYTNSRDITATLSVPQHQHCSLSVVFSNSAVSSEPLILSLSTFDVINVTASVRGSSICVTCQLYSVQSEGCYISIRDTANSTRYALTLINEENITVEGCTDNLPRDNYTVYIYDLETGQPVLGEPFTVIHEVSVTLILTTVSPTVEATSASTTNNITTISLVVVLPALFSLISLVIVLIVVWYYIRKRQKGTSSSQSHEQQHIPVSPNAAYEDINKFDTNINPAYGETTRQQNVTYEEISMQ